MWLLNNTELLNYAGVDYPFAYDTGSLFGERWTLPATGHAGYIESITSPGLVLGVSNDSTSSSSTRVYMEMKKEPISEGQKWIKGKGDFHNGWFNLIHPNSGRVLGLFVRQAGSGAGIAGNFFILIDHVMQHEIQGCNTVLHEHTKWLSINYRTRAIIT